MALVSVITICYSNPEELRRTLDSLAPLDPAIFECLVIDGSPDDACQTVSHAYRVRHLRGSDTGKYDAMNKGVASARGVTLLFMNSGDLLVAPDRLRQSVVAHGDVLAGTLLYGDAIFEIGGVAVAVPAPDLRPEHVAKGNLPSHQAILIPAAFHRDHLYDSAMHFAADTKLLKQAFACLPSRHLPFAVARFAYGGVSNSAGSWRSMRQQLSELREALELTPTETLATAASLVRRKLLQAAFGEGWFRRVQRERLIRSGRARNI